MTGRRAPPRALATILAAFALAACQTLPAPPYSAGADNVRRLQAEGPCAVSVGRFVADPAAGDRFETLAIRTNTIRSPVGATFADYLAEALRIELSTAGCLAPDAPVSITGAMLRNELDAENFNTGTATVAARFLVRRGERDVYERTLEARHQWESAYLGAIAIPRAQQEYAVTLRRLLASLFADEAFRRAISPAST